MDVKDFLPELRRMIQGPLQLVMADELFSSAIIFCKEAQVIREKLVPGDIKKGDEFTITASTAGLLPWGVVSVYNDNGELKRDVHYVQHSRTKIEFLQNIKGVNAVVWFYPTDRTNLPDNLLEHGKAISHGAASDLYLQPRKEWTDGSMSSYHKRHFVEGYRDAKLELNDQFGTFQNPQINNSYWT